MIHTDGPSAPPDDLAFILNKVHEHFPNLDFKNESILITGGTGFFGKWLTQSLIAMNDRLALGNEIFIVTRDRERSLAAMPWLKGRKDTALLETDIRRLKTEQSFTTIIHGAAAASAALNENNPEEMFNTILEGTSKVLELSAGCKRFQFISSGAVYGTQPTSITHLSESYEPDLSHENLTSAYGRGKRAAEALVLEAQLRNGFNLSIPRCFAFVGPYLPLDTHFAIGNFIKAVLNNEPIQIGGDGTPHRSYLYSADLAVWLLVLLLKDEAQSTVNVGSDESISIADLAAAVNRAGIEVLPSRAEMVEPIRIAQTPKPGALPSRYVPSIDYARDRLKLKPWTDLNTAILKTLRWNLARGA